MKHSFLFYIIEADFQHVLKMQVLWCAQLLNMCAYCFWEKNPACASLLSPVRLFFFEKLYFLLKILGTFVTNNVELCIIFQKKIYPVHLLGPVPLIIS